MLKCMRENCEKGDKNKQTGVYLESSESEEIKKSSIICVEVEKTKLKGNESHLFQVPEFNLSKLTDDKENNEEIDVLIKDFEKMLSQSDIPTEYVRHHRYRI